MPFPKEPKVRQPQPGVKIPSELIIAALKRTKGNISRAADRLGCDRHTIRLRADKEEAINQVLINARERFLDETEDVLAEKVLSGDTSSIIFTLKCLGKKRGYDFETNVVAESVTKGALEWVMNKSKNPAE